MNRSRSGPTLTQVPVAKLEILGDSAVENKALLRIVLVEELQRVAELVVAVLVESLGA